MYHRLVLMLMCISCFSLNAVHNASAWTWFHRKKFTLAERITQGQQTRIISSKIDLPLFNQLIFSWNALRPENGNFTFWAQVRNAKTKQWSSWHKMVCWGANIQKSFSIKKKNGIEYAYVRLESEDAGGSDGFRIKITAHDGASLGLIHGFNVSLSDLNKFKSEVRALYLQQLTSVQIDGVPALSQLEIAHPMNHTMCSPTSCAMLLSYMTKQPIDALSFALGSFDNGLQQFCNWPMNSAHAFERAQGSLWFSIARLSSFKQLHMRLVRGLPVVVSVRGTLPGALKSFPQGHLLVVIGYDKLTQEVICHDPACISNDQTRRVYPLKNFLACWERSYRLAYLAEPVT